MLTSLTLSTMQEGTKGSGAKTIVRDFSNQLMCYTHVLSPEKSINSKKKFAHRRRLGGSRRGKADLSCPLSESRMMATKSRWVIIGPGRRRLPPDKDKARPKITITTASRLTNDSYFSWATIADTTKILLKKHNIRTMPYVYTHVFTLSTGYAECKEVFGRLRYNESKHQTFALIQWHLINIKPC